MTDKTDWTTVKFGDVVRQVKDKADAKSSGLKWYVAGEHMDTDDLRIRRRGEITDDYLGPAFHMRFKPGHVLYGSRRTYLRKVAVADFEGICANTTFVLKSRDPTVLQPDLLPFVMQTEAFHAFSIQNSKGSVNPYINFSDLAEYEFALPPLAKQQRLVDLLRKSHATVDAARICLEKGEGLLRRFILDEYLFASSRFPSQKTEVVGAVLMGRQKAPKYRMGKNPRPYLRVANIGELELHLETVEQMDFTDREMIKYRLQPGDILLTEGDLKSISRWSPCRFRWRD